MKAARFSRMDIGLDEAVTPAPMDAAYSRLLADMPELPDAAAPNPLRPIWL